MKVSLLIKFEKEVCQILGIEPPKITFVKELKTKTQIAALTPDGILFKNNSTLNPADWYFALAHELRHAWQIKNGFGSLEDYLPSDSLNIHDYNMQKMEIDAHAFASLIMESLIGLKPLFNGLPPDVIKAIEIRKNELIKIYNRKEA